MRGGHAAGKTEVGRLELYLAYDGRMGGGVPDWYEEFVLARALHCPPWELDDRPLAWKAWAAAALSAEAKAQEIKAERARRESGHR